MSVFPSLNADGTVFCWRCNGETVSNGGLGEFDESNGAKQGGRATSILESGASHEDAGFVPCAVDGMAISIGHASAIHASSGLTEMLKTQGPGWKCPFKK